MLTCIARPKQQQGNNAESVSEHDDNSKQAIKTLTSQIKGIALKASGAYKCNPCSHPTPTHVKNTGGEADSVFIGFGSESFKRSGSYRRTTSSGSASRWGKEMEARLKVLSRDGTPSSSSGSVSASASRRRMDSPVLLLEETEPKEWVAQVEPGVLITFLSLPRGGNDLRRIRFSRDMFNKWQAQKWWTDNYEKVMELYNVHRLNQQAFPLPTPLRSEDEMSKMESMGDSPVTPPLNKESLPRSLYRGQGAGYSSSDSFEQQSKQSRLLNESSGLASTPEMETSSMDESSLRSTSSADQSGQLSFSNVTDLDAEWVEEDEPGVYITIRALPGGTRELSRVRFSRAKFGEMHARLWWEENRSRIHQQYL